MRCIPLPPLFALDLFKSPVCISLCLGSWIFLSFQPATSSETPPQDKFSGQKLIVQFCVMSNCTHAVTLLLHAYCHILRCYVLSLANSANYNNGGVHLAFPTCDWNVNSSNTKSLLALISDLRC